GTPMKYHSIMTALAFTTLSTAAVANESVNTSYDDGYLNFATDSGSFSMKFDGRIMLDAGAVSSDLNEFVENNSVRRARFGIKTRFANKWAGEFDIDFAENEAEIKDMWVSYIGLENFEFKFGHHKPFFSLGELTTSRWATFMETSMITDVTAPGRRIGLSGSYYNERFFVGLSVFGDGIDVDNRDPEGDESEPGVHEDYSHSFRALYRPIVNADQSKLLHIGVNYLSLKPESDDGDEMRLRVGLESSVFDYNILNTGKIKDVDSLESRGIEIAAKYNKFNLQAEYLTNTFESFEADEPDVDSDGYYIDVAYMIWGKGRTYNLIDGEFGAVIPSHPYGDLEVAIRYSSIDLNDIESEVFGGDSQNLTFALNWYAHSNVVFRLNHTIASLGQFADGDEDYIGGDDISITGARIQFMF
ncbi:MAG: porin, partial [Nonlabens ulvanivorans]|uniref:OprO/OprP family phosphate-selective porin n=1 Tax=Nonlabens ulvanivorans TaxID=906888 RepID=UPI0032636E6A